MTATRIVPNVVPKHLRNPQAAPTRARATATAAGRAPGAAAPAPRRAAPTTRTRAAAATGPATRAAVATRPIDPDTRTRAAADAPVRATGTRARTKAGTPARPIDPDTRTLTRASAPAPRRAAPTNRTRGASAAPAATSAAATARPLTQTEPQPQPRTQPVRQTPLRIVGPPEKEAKARRRRRLWVGAFASLACAGLFAIVGVRVLLAQGQAPIDQLESRVADAQADNQRLRFDVARLESPSRIVAEAQSRLGMVAPAAVVYLSPLTQPAPNHPDQTQPDPTQPDPTQTEQSPLTPAAG